jgi:cytochrome c
MNSNQRKAAPKGAATHHHESAWICDGKPDNFRTNRMTAGISIHMKASLHSANDNASAQSVKVTEGSRRVNAGPFDTLECHLPDLPDRRLPAAPPSASSNRFKQPIDEPLMKTIATIIASSTLALASNVAFANADLARAKNCFACHEIGKMVVGPAYKDVAAKYANDKTAVERLAKKVREGGVGVWGPVPMPANLQVSEAEARTLVQWVLTQK